MVEPVTTAASFAAYVIPHQRGVVDRARYGAGYGERAKKVVVK
ncbi:MAG TPA: hypothetical protein VGA99_14185 [bacterium]